MEYRMENFRVEADIGITTVHEVRMEQGVNGHGRLTMSGFCEGNGRWMSGQERIFVKDGTGGVLFAGIICEMEKDSGYSGFRLKARSFSSEMDREKRRRVFQHPDMTYGDVIREVLKRYENASFINTAADGVKMPPLIVQYNETDWEFLVRLASHFGTGICGDCGAECVRLFFGLPAADGEGIRGKETARRIDLAQGQESIELRTKVWREAGRRVVYEKNSYFIRAAETVLEKGELLHRFRLERNESIAFPYIENSKIAGVRMKAVTEEICRDTMRIRFLADEGGAGDTPYFPYGAEVNNEAGFYMPDPGVRVDVFFPDGREENAFVTAAARTVQGFTNSEAGMKYMRNREGRELYMDGEKLRLSAGNGNSSVEMRSVGELVMEAPETIRISAGADLKLGGRTGKIVLQAGKGVSFTGGRNSQIWMDEAGNVNCKSSKCMSYNRNEEDQAEERGEPVPLQTEAAVSSARGAVMAMAGTEFLAESITGKADFSGSRKIAGRLLGLTQRQEEGGGQLQGNRIKAELLQNDERLFRSFSYGENKNG